LIAAALLFAASTCAYESCATAKPDIRACKCVDPENRFVIRIHRGDRLIHESRHEAVIPADAEIEALRLDLDADGRAEIIAAASLGMSNGLGVHYWAITIVDGRSGKAADIDVEDYGDGTFRREPDGRYTVLDTSWEWLDGAHLYFVARPYAYHDGALTPEKWRGMWIRRFLFSFERERANDTVSRTAQWLRKAKAVTWADPQPP